MLPHTHTRLTIYLAPLRTGTFTNLWAFTNPLSNFKKLAPGRIFFDSHGLENITTPTQPSPLETMEHTYTRRPPCRVKPPKCDSLLGHPVWSHKKPTNWLLFECRIVQREWQFCRSRNPVEPTFSSNKNGSDTFFGACMGVVIWPFLLDTHDECTLCRLCT